MPGGVDVVRDVAAGAVVPGKAQSHVGENVGETDTHVLIVEFKRK